MDFFAPVPRGLEPLLVDELRSIGAVDPKALPGGVQFSGDWAVCYRANLESRLATRVMLQVASGRYRSEDDVYRIAYAPTWARWFTADQTLRVFVTAHKSPLRSLEFTTLRIKDAVCDHFRSVAGRRPNVDTKAPDVRIHAFLSADTVTLYLDTSGEPLYKRGFKPAAVEAPLKENLAAGILRLTGWQPGSEALVDPMCGSGTFLIEAAQMALDVAPGLGRRFGFEKFKNFERDQWLPIRQAAEARRQAPRPLPIHGSDILEAQERKSIVNLRSAGLDGCVTVSRTDMLELAAPAASGVLVANPPYGVRLSDMSELRDFYPRLGSALKAHWAGWRCYFFSGDPELPKGVRLKASKRTPLFNGAIECRLYEFAMVAGSARKPKGEGGAADAD
ncbi:MAG TPA: THUMP domain-containing protein [Zoogloea sp.]|uniref:THUMP domain-containing class I SAM-dependent RNA methyltransferase n=1 Tax=Zoogloea sp. TaxID=49181 RepID=UPI002B98CC6D|nr:THUMP domain-containing protein [Zoogloea sp.]HMV17527.1 THUMP domain-containing protein [Rhodocyclaceae bacterium]HMV62991.1 THUMP domain-containing protein [Rhodocyclaceae bacterium]HMW52794.1 THUMP domain-containing protein [Rhodocyclaceae bacterium]HMY49753.1 THUMP domain-containing protein [Rhodocyclaceae bacterium]HMZ75334.1 THUMP domain-containing protein [Rhodocyclaceae bacterium]